MIKSFTSFILLFFALAFMANAQSTNKGTEFWTAYMANIRGVNNGNPSQMSLYLTSDVSTSGVVAIADGSFSQNFNVTANQVTIVDIPSSAFLGSEGLFTKGIHVTAASPIVVYAHNYASAVSAATLVLPVNTLAKDYYSINYKQLSNETGCYSSFAVVATEDTTTVEITPTSNLLSGIAANAPFTITLQKGQVYQGLSVTDLTGTRIRSISSGTNVCKKIAVFSGSSKIMISNGSTTTLAVYAGNNRVNASTGVNISADNLFQQAYPTASWGRNYITAPLGHRPYDIFRIAISDPTTVVTLNGSVLSSTSFTNGFYYEFTSTAPNIISADKPIQVAQYAITQLAANISAGDVGDPEMIFLNPIEQNVNNVTLYSPTAFKILQSYVNVIIATNSAASFTIDGSKPATAFAPVPGNAAYSYGQFAVFSGTHNINASTGFNAIAYGFGSAESYGYSAGTNLKNLNEFLQIRNSIGDSIASACVGDNIKLEITLPYQTKQLIWYPQNGDATLTVNNPTLLSQTTKDSKPLYTYAYGKTLIYTKSGSYDVKVKAFNAIADACGSYEDLDIGFVVNDNPVADFTVNKSSCQSDTLGFTDKSSGATIKTWNWSFGDGGTSTIQNPTHIYKLPGDFIATLMVTNSNGCTSILDSARIHIYAKPVSAFIISNPDCAIKAVTITDQSTAKEGKIVQWFWDFGDGSTQASTSATAFQHVFTTAGSYLVKLYTVTDLGCHSDTISKQIIVHPLPIVNFTLPEICISDSYATFTDKSSIADHTESDFTYLWDFGDAATATATNPNTSTDKNPQHRYTKAAKYAVKLTVASANGCAADTSFEFTVNGAVPKADFEVLNSSSLCSKQAVMLRNTSTLDFGNLSKVVIYYDYANHPDQSETDENPVFDKLYIHQYPVFASPASLNYTVVMRTYSGLTCVDEKQQVITINANPKASFILVSSVCAEAAPIQIVGSEVHNYAGSGLFSGIGVNGSGLFNPASAKTGTQTITYIFTAQNGCADTVSKQIAVYPTPMVSAGKDITLLEGNSQTLNATVKGDNLTYQWLPAAGLSNPAVLNPVVSATNTTTYTLTATSAEGCTSSDQITVNVLKALEIPNTFTPNNDGINDTWNIKYLDSYPDVIVQIFNRYGVELYYSKNYSTPWDGRFRGADLPVGVYYYIISPGSGRNKVAGSVTIIR